MAENKKSFVLYADLIKSIDHLTNEEKGILFTHLLEYVNDKKPILTDRLILTAWKPIELQLKRDLIKFEEVKEKRSEAGKRSAEMKANKLIQQNLTKSTSVESVKQTSTKSTDNVNDNVNVNVNVINDDDVIKAKPNTPPTSSIEFMTIDDCRKHYDLFNKSQKEQLMMNKRLKVDEITFLQNKFDEWIKSNDTHKIAKDYASHFSRWILKPHADEILLKFRTTDKRTDEQKRLDFLTGRNQ